MLGAERALASCGGFGREGEPGGPLSKKGKPDRELQHIDKAIIIRNCLQSQFMENQPLFLNSITNCFSSNPVTQIIYLPWPHRFCSKWVSDSECFQVL